MKAKLPTTRAKTAYGLLSAIVKLIIDEPKRYNQRSFIEREGHLSNCAPIRQFPVCGTVGCVAGWAVVLKGPDGADTPYCQVERVAEDILGLEYEQSEELFSGSALANKRGRGPRPQTITHARAGVRHIRAFQKAHKAQLLAKQV